MSSKENMMKLSREELKRAAKVMRLKGYGNANKEGLVDLIMRQAEKISKAEYDAEGAILLIRETMGLSTSGNLKSRTAGLRKSKAEDAKSAKQIAQEAMVSVRAALKVKGKPKLKKQFLARMKKEMDDFEKELMAISSKQPAVAARKTANKSYKDSAEMKQDF